MPRHRTQADEPHGDEAGHVPPPTATRALRRMPLRRMPTELTLTTRMPPVRHGGKPGSGVRPITEPALPAEPAPADATLSQLRRQLSAALDNARQHEQRALKAELRAFSAERLAPQRRDPEPAQPALPAEQRRRWIKRVLEISCIGFALGGYISLLIPIRERVIAQSAMIHELTAVQRQLRDEKGALVQRIENLQAPSEAQR